VKLNYAEELQPLPTPERTAQTVIVQCPSCQTKFSLEQEKLFGISDPQFHCSKCDHTFSGEKPSLRIPKKTDPSFVPSPPIEKFEEPRSLRSSIEKSVTEPAQIEFLFGDYPSEPTYKGLCDILPIEEAISKPKIQHEKAEKRSFTQVALSEAPKRKPPLNEWQSCGVMAGIMIFFIGLLAVFSYIIVSSPSIADSITSDNTPMPAPPELVITKAKLELTDLDNGEQVPIISGTLVNHGKTPLSEIIIRGFLFDKKGAILAETEISAASPLSETKVKSLSRDMIKTLQGRSTLKKFTLAAGESIPFSLALLDESLIKDGQLAGASFSTQIYSAR